MIIPKGWAAANRELIETALLFVIVLSGGILALVLFRWFGG